MKPLRQQPVHPTVAVLAFLLSSMIAGGFSLAQSGNIPLGDAQWMWEVSADGGTSWQEGVLDVPASQASVRVRARCLFEQQQPSWYYGVTYFDATVSNAGPGDTVDTFRFGQTLYSAIGAESQRFGNVIKIDRRNGGDTLPPGEGHQWLSPAQLHPFNGGIARFDNPFLMFEYRLNLDGTAGTREIGGVFLNWSQPGVPVGQWLLVYDRANPFAGYYQSLHFNRTAVRVVPTPAVLTLLVGALAIPHRRRPSS